MITWSGNSCTHAGFAQITISPSTKQCTQQLLTVTPEMSNNYCCQHFVKDGSSMSPSTVSLCEITLQFTQLRYSSQLKTAFTTPSTTDNAASSSFVTLHFSYTSSILSMCWMAYFAGTFRILWSAHLWLCSRFYTHKEGNMYSRHTGLELNWHMYFEVLHIPSTLLFFSVCL